jgi:hypothetical protein
MTRFSPSQVAVEGRIVELPVRFFWSWLREGEEIEVAEMREGLVSC